MKLFWSDKTNYFSWYTRKEGQAYSEEIRQVYIEISTFCNFSCEACMRNGIADFRPQHLNLIIANRLIKMLKKLPYLERIVLLGFGESMCNPDFESILKKLRTIDADIVMVSNLSLFRDNTLGLVSDLPVDEVWASWDDALNGETVSIRRGSEETRFKQTLESIVSLKKKYQRIKKVGLEVVASKMNLHALPGIFSYAASTGIDECIVTNVFPYSESMADQVLYDVFDKTKTPKLIKLVPKNARNMKIRFPDMVADRPRLCPFVEKGSVFISASGNVAPCPELAYTHPAYYFGSKRTHSRKIFGSVKRASLNKIWHDENFIDFRKSFKYFEYADCSTCNEPDMCYHRTVEGIDCFNYDTPCGECLWAKNIVICP